MQECLGGELQGLDCLSASLLAAEESPCLASLPRRFSCTSTFSDTDASDVHEPGGGLSMSWDGRELCGGLPTDEAGLDHMPGG